MSKPSSITPESLPGISAHIWQMKYRFSGSPEIAGDQSVSDSWRRVARAAVRPVALDPHVRERLARDDDGSVRQLEELLGHDLPVWKSNDDVALPTPVKSARLRP